VGRNFHPTLKPLKLTRYLATLLLPPAEYAPRRILIPFAGTFSEGIGAMLAGWEEVTGIEMEGEYCQLGRLRAQWWLDGMLRTHSSDPHAILNACGKKGKAKQDSPVHWPAESLFGNLEEAECDVHEG